MHGQDWSLECLDALLVPGSEDVLVPPLSVQTLAGWFLLNPLQDKGGVRRIWIITVSSQLCHCLPAHAWQIPSIPVSATSSTLDNTNLLFADAQTDAAGTSSTFELTG